MTRKIDQTPEILKGSYTFNEAIERAGTGRFHWTLIFLLGVVNLVDAWNFFMMPFVIPILQDIWDLPSYWNSLMSDAFVLGVFIANLLWAKLADIYGRRKVILIGLTTMSISTTMTIFVTDVYCLLICRFFAGLGFVTPVIMTLLLEFSPVKDRAKSMVYYWFFWPLGGLLSIITAWIIIPSMSETIGWRYYFLATSVPAWLVAIAVHWVPESARWYITAGEFDKAEKFLKLVLTINGEEPFEGRMVRESLVIKRGQIKDVFVPQYRTTSLLLITILGNCIVVYFGISYITERLFEDKTLYISEFITNFSELPGIAFGLFMSRISWRWMMTYTRLIPALALLIVYALWPYVASVSYIRIVNVVLVFAARGLSLTDSIVILTYYTVYYPTAIRTTAVGIGYGFSRLMILVILFVVEDFEIDTAVLILSINAFVGFGISLLLTDITIQKDMTN
jgi:MFS family permease